jgi:hypothetical protein
MSQQTREQWVTEHVDKGHGIARWESYDACSCGATFWRDAVTPAPPEASCPHCKLPAVMPEVCTPAINDVLNANIERDREIFEAGRQHGIKFPPEASHRALREAFEAGWGMGFAALADTTDEIETERARDWQAFVTHRLSTGTETQP